MSYVMLLQCLDFIAWDAPRRFWTHFHNLNMGGRVPGCTNKIVFSIAQQKKNWEKKILFALEISFRFDIKLQCVCVVYVNPVWKCDYKTLGNFTEIPKEKQIVRWKQKQSIKPNYLMEKIRTKVFFTLFKRKFSILLKYGKFTLELVADHKLELWNQQHCNTQLLWLFAHVDDVIISTILPANKNENKWVSRYHFR